MTRCVAAGWLLIVLPLVARPVHAGEADVLEAKATCDEARVCRFEVTLRHGDEGWDHYADKWEVLDEEGRVLAVRELAHPHVHEQPFTRSLDDVEIPEGVETVTIRAHDSVHGYGGEEIVVAVPAATRETAWHPPKIPGSIDSLGSEPCAESSASKATATRPI